MAIKNLICHYKTKYNLSDKNIKQILSIILLFIKTCYINQYKFKKGKDFKDSEYEEKIQTKFFLSEEKLSKYVLLDIFKKKKMIF